MGRIVNVTIAVDTQGILARWTDPSLDAGHPTHLADDLCMIVGRPAHSGSGAAPHLALAEAVGTALRWRAMPLSPSAGQAVLLYDVEPLRAPSVMSRAVPILSFRCVPLPVLDDGRHTVPPTFTAASRPDYHMATAIARHGNVAVRIRFCLTRTDPDSGAPAFAGCFEWRPTITVG